MSNAILNLVWGANPFGHASRRSVMVALADHADDQGRCFPGVASLALRTELSTRTVLRCISDLETAGWVKVKRKSVGPLRTGSSYDLEVSKLRLFQRPKHGTVTPIEIPIRDTVADTEVTPETSIGDIGGLLYKKNPHEPSYEPKLIALSRSEPTDEGLERVYNVYPRKVGRIAALTAIRKAVSRLRGSEDHGKLTQEQAIALLERQARAFAASAAGNRGKYTPHPATWFNHGRYLDDPQEWRSDETSNRKEMSNGQSQRNSPAAERLRASHEATESIAARYRSKPVEPPVPADAELLCATNRFTGNAGDVVSRVDHIGDSSRIASA